jgi:HAE1 family hydrophobic/amphiphilic exporter-1
VNGGTFYLQLKPRNERPPVTEIIAELRRQVAAVRGINIFFQPIQNLNIGVGSPRSFYQYTPQSGDLDQLYRFTPLVEAQMRRLPVLEDVGSDLQIKSPQAVVNVDRDKAASATGTMSSLLRGIFLWQIWAGLAIGFAAQISTPFRFRIEIAIGPSAGFGNHCGRTPRPHHGGGCMT